MRLSKATNRKNLLQKYGYDTKFASHLVRLMLEGKELLSTGRLEFPLKYADKILEVKQGKWKMEDVLEYAQQVEDEVQNWETDLPKNSQYDKIQSVVKDILKSCLLGT